MPTTSPTIGPDELYAWLGYATPASFQNAARGLSERHNFPPKLAGRPIWCRTAVLKWIARQGGAEPVAALATAPLLEIDDDYLEQTRKDLERLYAGDGFHQEAAE